MVQKSRTSFEHQNSHTNYYGYVMFVKDLGGELPTTLCPHKMACAATLWQAARQLRYMSYNSLNSYW